MKTKLITILATVSMLFTACSPTFDADNPKESLKKMGEKLDDDKKKELAAAFVKIGLSEAIKGKNEKDIAEMLDGKTADEIIEMAK